MVQVIQRTRPTFGEKIGAGLERGLEKGMGLAGEYAMKEKGAKAEQARKQEFAQQIMNDPALANLDPQIKRMLALEAAGLTSAQSTKSTINSLRDLKAQEEFSKIRELMGGGNNTQDTEEPVPGKQNTANSAATRGESPPTRDYEGEIRALEPYLLHHDQRISGAAGKEIENLRKRQNFDQKTFESQRGYHTQFSKPIEEKVAQLRESIPRKESALNLARNAIEEGDVSYFSKDKLADITGMDLFRTAKGAQLITAGKENLLSNMARTSARAQNIWFEQRLNSMFPKIGQSDEANLTVQEMLEGEVAMDKIYQEAFDRMSSEDENNFGYVKKDIDKRVHSAIKDAEKEIFNRTSYRIRELEESEMGIEKLKGKIGKNVAKGTPLTLSMAKLYKDKFGDNALQVAKKNGYYIPTLEEFKRFRERPQEFREGFE